MANNECDIEEIKRNANAQGIPLQEIAIIYHDITESEKSLMRERNLLADDNGSIVTARFTEAGEALFPEKIYGCIYLGA